MNASLKIQEKNQLFFNRQPRTNNKITMTRAASGCRGKVDFVESRYSKESSWVSAKIPELKQSLGSSPTVFLHQCMTADHSVCLRAFSAGEAKPLGRRIFYQSRHAMVDLSRRESGWPFFSLGVVRKDTAQRKCYHFYWRHLVN